MTSPARTEEEPEWMCIWCLRGEHSDCEDCPCGCPKWWRAEDAALTVRSPSEQRLRRIEERLHGSPFAADLEGDE